MTHWYHWWLSVLKIIYPTWKKPPKPHHYPRCSFISLLLFIGTTCNHTHWRATGATTPPPNGAKTHNTCGQGKPGPPSRKWLERKEIKDWKYITNPEPLIDKKPLRALKLLALKLLAQKPNPAQISLRVGREGQEKVEWPLILQGPVRPDPKWAQNIPKCRNAIRPPKISH